MIASYLKIRCFLEGFEIPVISASVVSSINDIARANVEIIATPEALLIRPKTSIVIYYYDDIGAVTKTTGEIGVEKADDSLYKLMFFGEVSAISMNKTSSGRVVSLTCVDHFENLSRAYAYFVDQSRTVTNLTATQGYFSGANTGYTMIGGQGDISIMQDIFKNPTPQSDGLSTYKGILGAVVKTIEIYTGITRQNTAGVNPFFTYQQQRHRILEQVTAFTGDTEAIELFNSSVLANFIARTYGIQGGLLKISDLIGMILSMIGYVRVPNPTPYSNILGDPANVSSTPQDILNIGNDIRSKMSSAKTVSDAIVNVFGSVDNMNKIKNLYSIQDMNNYVNTQPTSSVPIINEYVRKSVTLPQVEQDLATLDIISLAGLMSAQFKNDPLTEISPDLGPYSSTLDQLTRDRKVLLEAVEGLHTMIIMPDLFYADPPKCNVLFPNMYQSLSYSRNTDAEISRLALTTNISKLVADRSKVTETLYYAPSVSALDPAQGNTFIEEQQKAFISQTGDSKSRLGVIMDHEMLTGIVPDFATMSRFELVLKESDKITQENTDMAKFFATYADLMFFQRRLSARSLSASGPFNPFCVVGFPMFVIDSPHESPTEQFVGLLQSVTHSINQSGGSTSYSVIYPRPVGLKDDEVFSKLGDDLRSALFPGWMNQSYRPENIGAVYKELIGCDSLYEVRQEDAISKLQNLYKVASAREGDKTAGLVAWRFVRREVASKQFVEKKFLKSDTVERDTMSNLTESCIGGASESPQTHSTNKPRIPTEKYTDDRKSAVVNYVNSLRTRSLI